MKKIALIYPYTDYKDQYFKRGSMIPTSQIEPSSVYFDIIKSINNSGNKGSYFAFVSENFFKLHNIQSPYIFKHQGVDVIYTKSVNDVKQLLAQDTTFWIRGNYIFWRDIVRVFPQKRYILLPCYSKITYQRLKIKPEKTTVLVDENSLLYTFKKNKMVCDVFKKPAKQLFYKKRKIDKDLDLLFVCSSTDREHKRFDLVLDAMVHLNNFLSEKLTLTVVGRSHFQNEKIEKLNKKLSNIEIIQIGKDKRVNQEELADYYARSKLTICASSIDSNPRIISESLACNTPVLCPKDLLGGKFQINLKTGLFFNPTPDSLSLKILEAMSKLDKFEPRKECIKMKDAVEQILLYST